MPPVSSPPPESPGEPPSVTLSPHHLRLFALIIDYLIIVIVLNLGDQIAMGEHWDLRPLPTGDSPNLLRWIGGAVMLFLVKDAMFGRSPGKWFTGIAIRRADDPRSAPVRTGLLKRNVALLLLPVEAVLVFTDPHYRRLGDRWAGTVVIVPPRVTRLGRRVLAFSILVLGVLLTAFLVAPWNMRRTAAYQEAERIVRTHPDVAARIGAEISVDRSAGFSLLLGGDAGEGGGQAEVHFLAEGTAGQVEGDLVLRLDPRARRWILQSLALDPEPELEVEDAVPAPSAGR